MKSNVQDLREVANYPKRGQKAFFIGGKIAQENGKGIVKDMSEEEKRKYPKHTKLIK
jgi:hypothetical protein